MWYILSQNLPINEIYVLFFRLIWKNQVLKLSKRLCLNINPINSTNIFIFQKSFNVRKFDNCIPTPAEFLWHVPVDELCDGKKGKSHSSHLITLPIILEILACSHKSWYSLSKSFTRPRLRLAKWGALKPVPIILECLTSLQK